MEAAAVCAAASAAPVAGVEVLVEELSITADGAAVSAAPVAEAEALELFTEPSREVLTFITYDRQRNDTPQLQLSI